MGYFKSDSDIYSIMSTTITDVDKSQNSYLYKSQYPVALKLSEFYSDLDEALKKGFATTSYKSGYDLYLELRCAEMGVFRRNATFAIIKIKVTGTKNKKLPKGSVVSTNDNRCYTTQEDLILDENGEGYVDVKADKEGSNYNVNANEICYLPIKYNGIVSVTNEEGYYDAYDREDNSSLYSRYITKVRKIITSANKNQYEVWCKELDGVGDVKVIPLWDKDNGHDGRGTVKCVITNSNKRKADQELIDKVKNYIDPYPEGTGEGKAPIGATLTVTTVEEVPINVTAKVELLEGVTLEDVKKQYINLLESYFENTVYYKKKVSFAKTEGLLIGINDVSDVDDSSIKVNGGTKNIELTDEQIAIVGEIILEEI